MFETVSFLLFLNQATLLLFIAFLNLLRYGHFTPR
jgi:hypothetical protein